MMRKSLTIVLSFLFLSVSGCATVHNSKAKADAEELTQAWLTMVGEMEKTESSQPSEFKNEIGLKSKDSAAYNNRGITYFAHKQYQKALEDFNKAIELIPQYADPYFFRGFYYHIMAAYEKAVTDYNMARELNPKIDIARTMLNRIVIKTVYNKSGDDEADDDRNIECRWTKPIPFKETVACRAKKEWGGFQRNRKAAIQDWSSFPPTKACFILHRK